MEYILNNPLLTNIIVGIIVGLSVGIILHYLYTVRKEKLAKAIIVTSIGKAEKLLQKKLLDKESLKDALSIYADIEKNYPKKMNQIPMFILNLEKEIAIMI